jgi:hypothetical protein
MAVDVEIAGSSSLDSMDDPDVLNEGIGEEEEGVEDMMETENVGDEHPSHVQDGGHPLCCDADQGRMVLPTPKIAVAYSAKCRGFCLIAGGRYPLHVYEQKDQDDYAVRRCHQIDGSATLEAGTLYPIFSNRDAINRYDQYGRVLPLTILGRGQTNFTCRQMPTVKQWLTRQRFVK